MANRPKSQRKPPLKLPRQGGDLPALQRRLWFAILHCERIIESPGSRADLRLRAAHALSQLATTYINLTKTTDFEERLSALERALPSVLQKRKNGHVA
jgi:hypothetical protein